MRATAKVKTASELTPVELRQLTQRVLADYLGEKSAATLAKSVPPEALEEVLKSLRAGK